jgi:hypothetical protein
MSSHVRLHRPTRIGAWHPITILPGAETFCLVRDRAIVSRRYCAERVAHLVDCAGARVRVRVDGYGGAKTNVHERRHGYASQLILASRAQLAGRGFEVSLLFCLDPLVAFYRARGWTVYERGAVVVTFCHQGRGDPCPPAIHLGYWPLRTQTSAGQLLPSPDQLAAIEVEGPAW